MTIYHKHHIIPKHAGGTDDPSNIIQLTVEEHAEAHRKLFDEHGRWQDEIAWKMLSGMIDRAELISQIQSKSSSFHQRGSGNSQYGTVWCVQENATDLTYRKKFPKDCVPVGWITTKQFRQNQNKNKSRKKFIISPEFANALLADYESGMDMNLILEKYGRKSEQSVTTFLRKRFPDRKRFKPKERIGKQSHLVGLEGNAPSFTD